MELRAYAKNTTFAQTTDVPNLRFNAILIVLGIEACLALLVFLKETPLTATDAKPDSHCPIKQHTGWIRLVPG